MEGGSYYIGLKEWLEKFGSVGCFVEGIEVCFFGEDGEEVVQGEVGMVYFCVFDEGRFFYFKVFEKIDLVYYGDFYIMGDMGYFDEDGYFFLMGCFVEMIIVGGVNIYLQEIDDVFNQYVVVYEVCMVGVFNDEWGESVVVVVEVYEGVELNEELCEEFLVFCEVNLLVYKCLCQIDFVMDLLCMLIGKIQWYKVCVCYWEG